MANTWKDSRYDNYHGHKEGKEAARRRKKEIKANRRAAVAEDRAEQAERLGLAAEDLAARRHQEW